MPVASAEPEKPGRRAEGLFAPLADLIVHLDMAAAPDAILGAARLEVLDAAARMASGASDPAARRLRACEREVMAGPSAAVLACERRFALTAAARINACQAMLRAGAGGPAEASAIAILAAALAVAEPIGADGRTLLAAFLLGTEIVARLDVACAAWVKPAGEMGIDRFALFNAIGAAAAAAFVLRLDHEGLVEAMAMGGGLCGWGPASAQVGPPSDMAPMIRAAWPASAGLLAAHLAQGGMTGPVRLLESDIGLFSSIATHFDPAPIRARGWRARPGARLKPDAVAQAFGRSGGVAPSLPIDEWPDCRALFAAFPVAP